MEVGLFGDLAPAMPITKKESKLADRRRKAKLAFDYTADAWKKWTYKIAVEEFLPVTQSFLFENLSAFYNEQADIRRLPKTINGKAFSGLWARLIKEGLIEKIVGVNPYRSNGNQGHFYRSNLFRG